MKRRVCCFLLGICILCLPAQQVYAAPAGPAAKTEEKKKHENPKHHEHEHPKPHEHKHEKPVPPHLKEKPVPPHEKEHPKPQEEKKGLLAEKTANTPTASTTATPTVTPEYTVVPTVTPKPTVTPVLTQTPDWEKEVDDTLAFVEGNDLVEYALQFVGNPYKYGGTSLTNGADCSGFVQSIFAHFDYSLSRSSREQAKTAGYTDVEVKESELQPGDLIFYANSSGTVYHVAIYMGDGKVVHAANERKGITISEYDYMKPYKARRVIA